MNSKTKLYLMASGTVVYGLGYGLLIVAALQGELSGLAGVAAVLMATGILVALVFLVLLAWTEAELLGEL